MIDDILAARQKTHGDFTVHARITQNIKIAMVNDDGVDIFKLSDSQREALEMIAHKIGRIMAGDPNHADHWADIAGYATLVERQLTRDALSTS